VKLSADIHFANGRYRLERRLGAGGMASVWLASDEILGRRVAVKFMADTLAADARWRERFAGEARAAASITHPHVVRVFDYGFEDERPWLIMEYVSGGSLAEAISTGRAAELDVAEVAGGLLSALQAVHEAGIVHRDVKPGNVLLDPAAQVRLTDFGIARRSSDGSTLTQTGLVLGTVRYMAPEVVAGEPATVSSDLYSAGRVIGELAGARPPRWVRRLVDSLAAPEPERRPPSAKAALRLIGERSWPGASIRTAPTRPLTAPTLRRLPGARGRPGSSRPDRATGVGRMASVGVAGALILGLLVALAVGAFGSGPSTRRPPARIPPPASRTAPLSRQLDSLQHTIDAVARR
jgi:serine/threonine protein kinase